MVGSCDTYKGEEKCSVLFCKHEVKKSLARPIDDIIKIGFKEWMGVEWIRVAEDGKKLGEGAGAGAGAGGGGCKNHNES